MTLHKYPRRVLVRCDGNELTGLGHLSRCINLARSILANQSSTQIAFWGRFDLFARKLLAHYGLPILQDINIQVDDEYFGAAATLKVCAEFDVLLVDSYLIDQNYVDALKHQTTRLVLIDDEQRLDLSDADLVICFRAGYEKFNYRAKHQLIGPSYLPVKPEFHALRKHNLTLSPTRLVERILIYISGARLGDRYLPSILNALDFPGITITYLAAEAIPELSNGRVRHITFTPDIESVYSDIDFVVCGGGLTKYECAFMGIANACISLTTLQKQDTEMMAAQEFTLDLGYAKNFEASDFCQEISNFIKNPNRLSAQRHAFASKIGSDGTKQIVQAIRSL